MATKSSIVPLPHTQSPTRPRAPSATVSLSTASATGVPALSRAESASKSISQVGRGASSLGPPQATLGLNKGPNSRGSPLQTYPTPTRDEDGVSATTSLVESLALASEASASSSDPSTPTSSVSGPVATVHPFANSTAKLELLPPSGSRTIHGIDVEEEARLYATFNDDYGDEGRYEDATDDFTRTNTPVGRARRRTTSGPAKLTKSRPTPDPHAPPLPPFSASAHLRSQTTPYSSAYDAPPHSAPYSTYPHRSRAPPPESIFSADIYLADNTTSSGSLIGGDAPPLFAQDLRIDGWVVVGDGAGPKADGPLLSATPAPSSPLRTLSAAGSTAGRNDGHKSDSGLRLGKSKVGSLRKVGSGSGAYVVYDVAIVTREGTTMRILRRYSDFENLWEGLRCTLGRASLPHLPTLPPKAPLARFRPAFLENRRKHLEFWLAQVLLHPEIGGREVVREWVLKS